MGKQVWKPGNMLYPVPPVMVSCQRPGEKPNIITVAWAGTVCTSPAMVSISVRPERYSYDIIKETGEFVINLTTKELAYATDFCGVKSGRDMDKYKEAHLTPLASQMVQAPGIEESPVNIECKVKQILELGTHHMFLGEVVGVTIDDKYMDEKGKFHLTKADLITYSHGEYYGLGELLGTFGYSVKKGGKKPGSAGKKTGKAAGNGKFNGSKKSAGDETGVSSRMRADNENGTSSRKYTGNENAAGSRKNDGSVKKVDIRKRMAKKRIKK